MTDDGEIAPNGAYDVRVLTSNVEYAWEGVIGNTSERFDGPTILHAEDIIHGMVAAGGHLYIATGYNEARTSMFKLVAANPQAKSDVLHTRFRYTGMASLHVATDGQRIYWAGFDSVKPERSFVVASEARDDTEVLFSTGHAFALSPNGQGHKYKSVIAYRDAIGTQITGLAVQERGRFLFVARAGLGRITVIDKISGTEQSAYSVEWPTRLAVAENDDLWAIVGTTGRKHLVRLAVSDAGVISPGPALEIGGLEDPLALAASPDGHLILIADGAESQQVRAFDATTGRPMWNYGRSGGYAAGPEVADDKLMFHNFNHITHGKEGVDWTFLAFEADGSFWVGDSGNNRALLIAPDRRTVSRQIMWMPLFYGTAADPNDPSRVFGNLLEFHIDYAKPLAPANGSWRLVRNWSYGFPKDYKTPSALFANLATLKNGRTYAQMRSISRGVYELVELVSEKGLRWTGLTVPAGTHALHPDGSLRITTPVINRQSLFWQQQDLAGFDRSGNPQWTPPRATLRLGGVPAEGPAPYPTSSGLAQPWAATAAGNVVVFDALVPSPAYANHPVGHDGWHLGAIEPGSGRWLWKAALSTPRTYHGDWPSDGAFDIGNHVVGGASRAHVMGSNIFWQYFGEGWKGGRSGQVNKWTHLHESGLVIGQFGVVEKTMDMQEDEGQPGMAGNAASSSVVHGPDGRLYIYHNDESFHGGIHRWRIDGLDTIRPYKASVIWHAEQFRPFVDPSDLLSGLPRARSVVDGIASWHRTPPEDVAVDRLRNWWRVTTNIRRYRTDQSPDLTAEHSGDGSAFLWRKLPPREPVNRWKLTAALHWTRENHGERDRSFTGGVDFELLDVNGRILLTVAPKLIAQKMDYQIVANGVPLAPALDRQAFRIFLETPHTVVVTQQDGQLSAAIDGIAPVQLDRDPMADVSRPDMVRAFFWQSRNAYPRSLGLEKLYFE
ncbi:hypothetical protein [Methylocystis sp.]|uniref:hypothetical protein n=1 Tax=Methylocystis sp. TaxID=1911079 RepID=UPI003DA1E97C